MLLQGGHKRFREGPGSSGLWHRLRAGERIGGVLFGAVWWRLGKFKQALSSSSSVRGKLKVTAYVSDEISIERILEELGLSPPEEEKPPPIREVGRVPVDEKGREILAG